MKAAGRNPGRVVALTLTWDGARWPIRTLPIAARAFLNRASGNPAASSAEEIAGLLAHDQVNEIRVCWVPHLKGGNDVLSPPFSTRGGKRITFHSVKTVCFGDVLGVIYRRRL